MTLRRFFLSAISTRLAAARNKEGTDGALLVCFVDMNIIKYFIE